MSTTESAASPLINVVEPSDAGGDVAAVYGEMQAAWEMIPNPMKLYGTIPALLRHRWEGFKVMAEYEAISPMFLTFLRMLVSQAHDCDYCIGLNEGMLIGMFGLPAEQVMATKANPEDAPLDDKDKALLLFALKASTAPMTTSKEDMAALRALGWSDADIFFAVNYAADMVASDILINAFQVARDY